MSGMDRSTVVDMAILLEGLADGLTEKHFLVTEEDILKLLEGEIIDEEDAGEIYRYLDR